LAISARRSCNHAAPVRSGERSDRKPESSPQTTLGGYARGARILLHTLRQRGKRCLDPAAIRAARETITRRVGRCRRPRATRRGRRQGRGMQPSASRMGPHWGAANRDRTRRAKRRATAAPTALRPVGPRHVILDTTPDHVAAPAIDDARARLGASRRGSCQACCLASPPPCEAQFRGFLTISFS
jgi:hypothetical protein